MNKSEFNQINHALDTSYEPEILTDNNNNNSYNNNNNNKRINNLANGSEITTINEGNNLFSKIVLEDEFTSLKRKLSNPTQGPIMSFHNLNYTVEIKDKNKWIGKISKQILFNISGFFKPGMNAILGPTGGGKSSLLDILAGRKDPKGLSGLVLVNGQKQPKDFKCMSGYVVQDDIVMGTLTVRENFMFSANVRLSSSVSKDEKKVIVEDTLIELGLTGCADSKVGTEFLRGVSGGERKRTNIGMELIKYPGVLFLDEPTTGLDASTACAVMSLLHALSMRGRTIIFSIHQPRYTIFKLFDKLMLLGCGRTIYHGPAKETLNYIESLGYRCEEYDNPSDFFLDVINGESTAVQSNIRDHRSSPSELEFSNTDGKDLTLYERLALKYKESIYCAGVKEELEKLHLTYSVHFINSKPISCSGYATSFFTQFRYVGSRAATNLIRNPQAMFTQLIIIICLAIAVGIIYLQQGLELPVAIQNRVGAFFFIIMNQVFGNLTSIQLFMQERSLFVHERAGGYYRTSTYFFAKILCDLIPIRLVPLTTFTLISYFMVGFQIKVDTFFLFYLGLFLTTFAASSIGFFVGATFNNFSVANLVATFIYVFFQIFGGLLVNIATLHAAISWLEYFSVVRYSLNLLCINEFRDLDFYHIDNGTKIFDREAGNTYLKEQGISYVTAWDFWQNYTALAIIAFTFLTLAYIQLKRIPRFK